MFHQYQVRLVSSTPVTGAYHFDKIRAAMPGYDYIYLGD